MIATLVRIALFGAAVYFIADDEDIPVVLTSDDHGSTYQMDVNEEIVVDLDSNVTTSYSWAIDTLDEFVVASLGSTCIAARLDKVGLKPGTTELSLKHRGSASRSRPSILIVAQ
jgi:predicted secreted protein